MSMEQRGMRIIYGGYQIWGRLGGIIQSGMYVLVWKRSFVIFMRHWHQYLRDD